MVIDAGLIGYSEAYKLQKELVGRRRLGEIEDSAIFCEHPDVFTIGRLGKRANLLISDEETAKRGIELLRIDRGGDITYHGPGQLVAYFIVDLKSRGKDLHKYLRDLEDIIIDFLGKYKIMGERIPGKTGVWYSGKKIASIGVGCRDWITYHGVSININTDLSYFSVINPCGMGGTEMVSVENILHKKVPMHNAKEKLRDVWSSKKYTRVA